MIPIQATIVGFIGRPVTLFSAYDEDSRVLVVTAEVEYRRERRDGCVVITNDPAIPRDSLFGDEHLRDAITAFFAMSQGVAADGKSSRLVFLDKAGRANPVSAIEKDGIDAAGTKYRIADTISCVQVACLATAWYAHTRAGAVKDTLSMADRLIQEQAKLLRGGGILTI